MDKWRQENKLHILEYNKEKYIENRDQHHEYYMRNQAKYKKYREEKWKFGKTFWNYFCAGK